MTFKPPNAPRFDAKTDAKIAKVLADLHARSTQQQQQQPDPRTPKPAPRRGWVVEELREARDAYLWLGPQSRVVVVLTMLAMAGGAVAYAFRHTPPAEHKP